MPARTASSTTYWIAGLSTTGSISFGCAFVAGRKRVPKPAAGITALRTVMELVASSSVETVMDLSFLDDAVVSGVPSTRSSGLVPLRSLARLPR